MYSFERAKGIPYSPRGPAPGGDGRTLGVQGEQEMDVFKARKWLITSSLVITGANFLFFIVAPALGYPIRFDQSVSLMKIVLPVFLGYLGSATQFVFTPAKTPLITHLQFLDLIVRGPVIVFGVATLMAIVTFGYSNRLTAPAGSGMSVGVLSSIITASLGLLAVTTNVVVSYLFAVEERAQ
jgi:hypothetical protein